MVSCLPLRLKVSAVKVYTVVFTLLKTAINRYTSTDMNYQRDNISETQTKLTVTLNTADLTIVKPRTINRLAKKLNVPGFRPGNVPSKIAEKHLNPNSLAMELAEDAVNHFMVQVLETEKMQPLDRPKVELTKYVPSETLEFIAQIEVLPVISLGDYKKLNAKKPPVEVSDKEVDEVIERMRRGLAEKKDVDRPAKDGDEVTIDFAGTDKKGKPVAGAAGKDYPLTLGSSTFIPGFEEGLAGKKTGEHFDLPLTFPNDYHHKPLAGAEVTFAVTVKAVKEIALPEITDDFAAKCGPFKTVAELRADVTRELTDQKEREAVEKLKDSLIEQLIAGSKIPTPEILIADQMDSLERDFVQNLLYRGMTLPQYLESQGVTKEEWQDKELRQQATRRVQVGLALAELSKLENISVSTEELNARLSEMLQTYGKDDKTRKQLDTPEVRRDLANRLITEKTVDRLVELNMKN
jgi:trigger factor